MKESSTGFSEHQQADVFSRGSLKLTYDVLRPVNPALALQVRNILASEPLGKDSQQVDNEHSDCFRVPLDSFQVRAVVEAMAAYCQSHEQEAGMVIMAKSLLQDWINLAQKMISELPPDQRP